MIAAIEAKGAVPRARAVCDACGREEVATCDYEHKPGHRWVPNEGQMHRKMAGMGWSLVKGKLFCPACAAARRHGGTAARRHGGTAARRHGGTAARRRYRRDRR